MGKKTGKPADTAKTTDKAKPQKADKGEEIREVVDPKPGDIQLLDGIEYIYTKNKKFMLTPYEPEYVWVRKDQYTPGLGETVASAFSGGDKKTRSELEARLAKLEEENKKKGIAPQMGYPQQMVALPPGMGSFPGGMYMQSMITFSYPSPKMKRRVIVLPMEDQTNYKEEHLGELSTRRLVSRLENTNAIICIDPNTTNIKGSLTEPMNMKTLNEVYGVQAIIKGSVSDIFTSTSKIEGKDDRETSFAISKMSLEIFNTETGTVLKNLSGRNPVFLSREKGDLSSEKAKVKAIDLSIEIIADDLLKSILAIDWHARVASAENGKVYINAGRLSGLEKGGTLEVYSTGEQVVDSKTNAPLGRVKGRYVGELKVEELFGVDASWAKPVKGTVFSPSDLVYLKKD
ncbi:MAG: hypothetical protein C0392_03950 [Syntrophus sp. (in: bacteria)]|nr:hypothetical protein [Syntrophus sp. (in: bacteria)]